MSNYPDNCTAIKLENGVIDLVVTKSETLILEGSGAINITVEPGISLELVDLTESNVTITATLMQNSYLKAITLVCHKSINNYTVNYQGEGAELRIYGITVAREDSKIEFYTTVNHNQSNGYSEQNIKSIGADSSFTKFEGLIRIIEGVEAITAYQQNKNLLLSKTAQIKSRPWLEIYADDVKCSHGSTTGMLNPDEIYYMRQRGLTEESARKLQIEGFIVDIINNISSKELQDIAVERVSNIIDSL